MASEFDAIDYVRELEAAGVPHIQATIHAKALTAVLAVIRSELIAMGRHLTALMSEVKEETSESETRTQGQIVASEAQLIDRVDAFRVDVNTRFVALETKADAFRVEANTRFAALEAKADAFRVEVNTRFVALEAKADAFRVEVNTRFAALEAKADAFRVEVNTRFVALEARMSALEARVEGIASTLGMMKWMLAILAGSQVAIMGMLAKLLMA